MQTALYKEMALNKSLIRSVMIHLNAINFQNIPSIVEVIKFVSVSEKFTLARLFIKKYSIS